MQDRPVGEHAPSAHGTSRTPHLCVPLVTHSASYFAEAALCGKGPERFAMCAYGGCGIMHFDTSLSWPIPNWAKRR
jgi:hypothetical protein